MDSGASALDPLSGNPREPGLRGGARAESASRGVDGERRVITILFCDVANSTAMAAGLDPEEWAEIMNEAFHYMIGPVEEYGGTVARLMGDAVLAFFGAPLAHEDDPQRAVMAGLTIVNGIRPFAQTIKEDYGLDFKVRVGINTGPVVVGEVGSTLTNEYTALGDAINLAARMEQTALPGSVQITEDTYRLVASEFDVWPIENLQVKGKDEPITAYRILGVEAQPGRQRSLHGIETPLVGRDRELGRLQEALDAVRAGRSGIIFLIGEAGLGKSRLIAEARGLWRAGQAESVDGLDGWTEFVAASFSANRPYDLLKRQWRLAANLRESDPPELVHNRLQGLAGQYSPDLAERVQDVYGVLLGDASRGPRAGGAEQFQRRLHAVLRETTAFQASKGPSVWAIDDLHWADPASIEAIASLLPMAREYPMLFLIALRPEWSTPGWQMMTDTQLEFGDLCSSVFLETLSNTDSQALIDALLGDSGIPADLSRLLLEKAEGNPLFLEEVVRALIDSGTLAREEGGLRWRAGADPSAAAALVGVPGNLQALLMARIDRLEPPVRRTLQQASVIGRQFTFDILSRLADGTGDLEPHLKRLVQVDLVRQAAGMPGREYTFRHALARDAAYATILFRQRRRYHRRVAEAIEALYPDRLAEEAPRLAFHFAECNETARAIFYYHQAGEAAARVFANAEAIDHCSRGIELALAKPDAADDAMLLALFGQRGRSFELTGRYDEALANYEMLEQLGRERVQPHLEAEALVRQATIYVVPTSRADAEKGRAAATQALAVAEAAGDGEASARANWCLMLLHLNMLPDPWQAVVYGERALALAREHGSTGTLAYIVNDIARAYAQAGATEKADAAYREARDLWAELGDQQMLADLLGMWARTKYNRGEFEDAAAMANEGLGLSTRIGNLWGQAVCASTLGLAHFELGQVGSALQLLWYGLALAQRANFEGAVATIPLFLKWAYWRLGAPAYQSDEMVGMESNQPALAGAGFDNPEGIQLAVDMLRRWKGDFVPGAADVEANLAALFHAALAFALGDHAEVVRLSGGYLERMEQCDVHAMRSDLLLLRARSMQALGRPEAALPLLREACEDARAHRARRVLAEILPKLIAAETDPTIVDALRVEAREVAGFIAEHLKERDLRAAYLSQPALQAILA